MSPRKRTKGTFGKEMKNARKRDVEKAQIDRGALPARCFGEPRGDFAARAIFALGWRRLFGGTLPNAV